MSAVPSPLSFPFPSAALGVRLYKHFWHFRETGIILRVQKRKAGRLVLARARWESQVS